MLAAVETRVGPAQQLFDRRFLTDQSLGTAHPDTHLDRYQPYLRCNRLSFDASSDALCDFRCAPQPGLRQYCGELFAADPGQPIRIAREQAFETVRDACENFVTDRMPMLIVDRLEVVDIDDEQRQITAVTSRDLQISPELQIETTPIAHAGERIRHCPVRPFFERTAQAVLQGQNALRCHESRDQLRRGHVLAHVFVRPRMEADEDVLLGILG